MGIILKIKLIKNEVIKNTFYKECDPKLIFLNEKKNKKNSADFWHFGTFWLLATTLESVIDVGQGISVGPGKFGKKNKRRALNKHRAWKISQKV